MTVNINKPQINLREQLKKLERPTTDRLAVKGVDGVLIDKLTGELSLQGIDAVAGGSAVDVFVYNTSKDSDGGAWRKRTSHTSWYNETLNTATRGSRKEFPAVAVIVTEDTKVTIYDGDDPSLPMWMVFLSGPDSGNERLLRYARNEASAMLNAVLCVATRDTLAYISFIDEYHNLYHTQDEYYFPERTGIVDRNIIIAEPEGPLGRDGIANAATNDVAMIVLPNAPIGPSTGLPVPTIAVATDVGLSVITDSGSVFDDLTSAGVSSAGVDGCAFSGTKVVYYRGGASGNKAYVQDVSNISADFTGQRMYRVSPYGETNEVTDVCHGLADIDEVEGSDDNLILGAEEGIAIINENLESPTNGLVAKIASDYNTGWMPGKVKGAFLSDTDATNVTATELIDLTNGSVPAGNNASVASITANQLVFQSSSEAVGRYDTGTTLVTGKQYHATLTISNYSGSGDLGVASGGGFDATFRYSANGTYTRYITGDDASEIQLFYRNSNSATVGFSIKEIDLDRSVYPEGLIPFGTITKSAVATGAELVAYSGFSNSNYFEQPFNSIMQFGSTGDFSVSFWMKQASPATFCGIIDNGYNSSGNFYFLIGTDSNGKLFFRTSDSSGQSDKTASSQGVVTGGDWKHIVCTRTISGTQMNMFINGVLDGNSGSVTARNVTNSLNQPLKIGNRSNSTSRFFTGSLALVRVSASAPTAEQIKKMYEDEKHLYQEKAKATLYGSSDAVTALAYDNTTDLLHAGTSQGRSEFKGLRRTNNTATGVTTTISASNGLIAEQ